VEVRSHEFEIADPGPPPLGRIRDELAVAFTVAGDRRAKRIRRIWLDTFDWRLYRAGLTLQYVGGSGPGELVLTGGGGQQLTAHARQARWPCLPGGLPPGPLRDRVAAVAGLRALLPRVSVVSQVSELRLLNEDEKTVARIVVDAMTLPAPQGAAIAARLAVAEVRGYPAAARRVENRLGGADANPYLAMAASLACGYLGMVEGIKPTEPITGSAYDLPFQLPRTLAEALRLLRECRPLIEIFGERFVLAYGAVKESEYEAFSQVISAWEREHLLLNV